MDLSWLREPRARGLIPGLQLDTTHDIFVQRPFLRERESEHMATTNMKLIKVAPIFGATLNIINLMDIVTGIAPVAGDVFVRPREYPLAIYSKYFKEHNAPFRDPIICVVPKVGGGVFWLSPDEGYPAMQISGDGLTVTGDVFSSILNLSITEAMNFASFVGTIKNGVITV